MKTKRIPTPTGGARMQIGAMMMAKTSSSSEDEMPTPRAPSSQAALQGTSSAAPIQDITTKEGHAQSKGDHGSGRGSGRDRGSGRGPNDEQREEGGRENHVRATTAQQRSRMQAEEYGMAVRGPN